MMVVDACSFAPVLFVACGALFVFLFFGAFVFSDVDARFKSLKVSLFTFRVSYERGAYWRRGGPWASFLHP